MRLKLLTAKFAKGRKGVYSETTSSQVTSVTASIKKSSYHVPRLDMFSGHLTLTAVRVLDWISGKTLPPANLPDHLRTGRRGEEAAYFHLRKLG